jgi:hypothetical protein
MATGPRIRQEEIAMQASSRAIRWTDAFERVRKKARSRRVARSGGADWPIASWGAASARGLF